MLHVLIKSYIHYQKNNNKANYKRWHNHLYEDTNKKGETERCARILKHEKDKHENIEHWKMKSCFHIEIFIFDLISICFLETDIESIPNWIFEKYVESIRIPMKIFLFVLIFNTFIDLSIGFIFALIFFACWTFLVLKFPCSLFTNPKKRSISQMSSLTYHAM